MSNPVCSAWRLPVFMALALFLAACGGGSGQGESPDKEDKKGSNMKPLNAVVLVDLSDRLLQEDQAERDQEIIRMLWEQFEKRQGKQWFVNSRDRFRVVVAPQEGAQEPSRYEELIFAPVEGTKERTAPKFKKFSKTFKKRLNDLYKNATQGRNKQEDFPGADLWSYVHNYLPYDLTSDAHNVLIVLSDGYLDFEQHRSALSEGNQHNNSHFLQELRGNNHWRARFKEEDYGLLVRKPLEELNTALLLEMSPKHDWGEERVLLRHMWQDWLQRLGCEQSRIFGRLPLPTLEDNIQSYLTPQQVAKLTE